MQKYSESERLEHPETHNSWLGLISSGTPETYPRPGRHPAVVYVLKPGNPTPRLDSYRLISLISCTTKLMEKMVQRRLIWFLERHSCLALEITGFREHLSAQNTILNFASDDEFQLRRGHCVLAVFLNIQQALDRVRVDAIIHRLTVLQVSEGLTRYLTNYLTGRTFLVKLEDILSSPRPLLVGLTQGSTPSPILFNVAMLDIVPVSPRDGIKISTTINPDHLYIWASRDKMRPLIKAL